MFNRGKEQVWGFLFDKGKKEFVNMEGPGRTLP